MMIKLDQEEAMMRTVSFHTRAKLTAVSTGFNMDPTIASVYRVNLRSFFNCYKRGSQLFPTIPSSQPLCCYFSKNKTYGVVDVYIYICVSLSHNVP